MDRGKKRFFFHRSTFPLKNRLAITTGDPSGIGKRVACHALSRLKPRKNVQFLIWTDPKEKLFKVHGFQVLSFSTVQEALKSPFKETQILKINCQGGPGEHLKLAGRLCLNKTISALITGPVRKKLLEKYKARGQTDLLKKLCHTKEAYMCFRGRFFNVILWTDHIPLKKISINPKTFKNFLNLSLSSRNLLPESLRTKPLGLLGLNPHAGEDGLLGNEEITFLNPAIKSFSSKDIQGPLSPDVAFLKKHWKHYSFFIALYHDQGLIPFKMQHFHKGFAQTLGLPFLRLGVGHGTGQGLKTKNISSDSFLNALREAVRLIKQKN